MRDARLSSRPRAAAWRRSALQPRPRRARRDYLRASGGDLGFWCAARRAPPPPLVRGWALAPGGQGAAVARGCCYYYITRLGFAHTHNFKAVDVQYKSLPRIYVSNARETRKIFASDMCCWAKRQDVAEQKSPLPESLKVPPLITWGHMNLAISLRGRG